MGFGDMVCGSRCQPTAPAPGQNCYTLQDASDQCCNITVCDDPFLGKRPFKYYVIMFLTFLGPSTHLHFLTPPTHLFDDVILEWSLSISFGYCSSAQSLIFLFTMLSYLEPIYLFMIQQYLELGTLEQCNI